MNQKMCLRSSILYFYNLWVFGKRLLLAFFGQNMYPFKINFRNLPTFLNNWKSLTIAMSCLAVGFSTVVTSFRPSFVSPAWMADRSAEDGLAVLDMVDWWRKNTDWPVSYCNMWNYGIWHAFYNYTTQQKEKVIKNAFPINGGNFWEMIG